MNLNTPGSGIKRSNPDTPNTGNAGAQRRMLPDQIYANLAGRVTKFALADADDVQWLFGQIANEGEHGIEKPRFEYQYRNAFCLLIEHSEFALFAEVFTRYNEGRARHAAHAGESFGPTLHLKLPLNWIAGDVEAMNAAFTGLQVQCLKVEGPPYQLDANNRGLYPLVSEDGCHCIRALLLGGSVTELHIEGALANPDLVTGAFAVGHLQSLSIDAMRSERHFRPLEWSCHKALCHGLANCSTLQHLSFGHSLKQALATLTNLNGQQLLSLTLNVHDAWILGEDGNDIEEREFDGEVESEDEEDHRRQQMLSTATNLMGTAREFPELTALNVNLNLQGDYDITALKSVFLTPLQEHPKMEMLSIQSKGEHDFDPENIDALLDVVLFANTCPRLTYFSWKSKGFRRDAMDTILAFLKAGGKLRDPEKAKQLAAAFLSPHFKLKVLIMSCAVLGEDALKTLFGAMASGKLPLTIVTLKGCCLSARGMQPLPDVLDLNLNIEKFGFPDTSNFFIEGTEGRVYVYGGNNDQDFELVTDEPREADANEDVEGDEDPHAISDADRAEFQSVQAHANAAIASAPAKLAENRRTVMTKIASKALAPSLAELLTRSKTAIDLRIDWDGFAKASRIMLKHLAETGEFPTAARLWQVANVDPNNELNKQTSVRELVLQDLDKKESRKQAIRDEEQRLLHKQRQQTVPGYGIAFELESDVDDRRFSDGVVAIAEGYVDTLLDLIDDGLMLNVVARANVNVLLETAAKLGRADMVRILLQAGAVDFDDEVQQMTDDVDVQEVFRRHALAVTTTNSTTGTTTTTTTTTARATTGATPAVDDAFNLAELFDAKWRLHDAALDAIVAGDVAALQKCLDAGAPVDLIDENQGNVLLIAAVRTGNPAMVRLLIARKAEDYFGLAVSLAQTPEMVAAFDA